jgi:hypothetical protein
MGSITSFTVIEQLYAVFLETLAAIGFPCPRCGGRRARHSWRGRWVIWSVGHFDRLRLLRVRCRHCRTVETCFPPWLLPYEPAALWVLTQLCDAVALEGQSWARVEREGGWARHWLRRHAGRWLAWAPALRQALARQWLRWGWHWPSWSWTWRPPTLARVADWAWVRVAWAWTVQMGGATTVAEQIGDFAVWCALAPLALPAAAVPATTHVGRRLRATAAPP